MASGPRLPEEVFVSHSSRDRRFVRKLVGELARHDVRTWFSERHIVGSTQWHDEIGRAIDRCDWFLIVLTPNAVDSLWVRRELLAALNENRLDGRIVPALKKDCEPKRLSWTLPSIQYIDFRGNFESGITALLRVWDIRRRPA